MNKNDELCEVCGLHGRGVSCEGEPPVAGSANGYAASVREQDSAYELYQAACCLMRYKEADQWHNLENTAHRFNAARQARINDETMRHNNTICDTGNKE